jgi:hypothetical protein
VICADILQIRYWILCNLQSPTVIGRIYSNGESRGRPPIGPLKNKSGFTHRLKERKQSNIFSTKYVY